MIERMHYREVPIVQPDATIRSFVCAWRDRGEFAWHAFLRDSLSPIGQSDVAKIECAKVSGNAIGEVAEAVAELRRVHGDCDYALMTVTCKEPD